LTPRPDLSRRGFLVGLAALAAPAIIRTPGLLMPIKALAAPARRFVYQSEWITPGPWRGHLMHVSLWNTSRIPNFDLIQGTLSEAAYAA
jgi:hypothetical protein